MARAAAEGVPVPLPVPCRSGELLVEREGQLYTLNEANNLFPYYSAYMRGDERMRAWFKPGGFQPMIDAWRQVGMA